MAQRGRLHICFLHFAANTLVICKDTKDQMACLNWILAWFKALSELRINLDKSSLLPVGRVENSKTQFCRVWDGVEEGFCKRLAIRKRQYISKGGKLTLTRSTLSNMSTHIMSLFHLLKGGVKVRLEKIQRDFLWEGNLESKIHQVNWGTVLLSKEKGDLGIRSQSNFNKALLGNMELEIHRGEFCLENYYKPKVWFGGQGLVL